MAEHTLNTRILLKYDSYVNWTKNNPVLKAGEMAIATVANIDANKTTGFQNLPNVVLKVGDGTSHYNDLKFVSALAADVYEWAKAASKPEYGYKEIVGLEAELARVSAAADTDTQYNLVATDAANYKFELLSKEKSAVEWTKVADLDLSGIVSRVKALEDKFVGMTEATVVDHVNAEIAKLDNDGQTIETGEIIKSISQADGVITVTKRTLNKEDIPNIDQSQVNGLVKALEDINTAIGDAEDGSLADAKAYTDAEIQKLDYNGGDDKGEHKFVTVVTQADGVVAAAYAQPEIADVSGLETRLSGIEGNVTNLTNNKQDNLGFEGEYNKETNKVVTKAHLTSIIEGLDSDGVGFGDHLFVTKVTEADGIVTPAYAQPVIADIDGLTARLSGIDGEIAKKQDQLYFTSTPDNADNKVATQTYVNEAVANLEGSMHFIGKVDSLPASSEGYSAGDVIMVADAEDPNVMIEYVLDKTGTWQKLGHESIYELKADAKAKHEAIEKSIADLEKKHDDEMDALDGALQDAKDYSDAQLKAKVESLDYTDAAVAKQFVTAVSEADGIIAVTRRGLETSDFGTGENAILPVEAVIGLPTALENAAKAGTDAAAKALADAKTYAEDQVKALDYNDTAVEKQFVTEVKQADGAITVQRADVADIALTGNVNDLIQTTGDYLIFNCGNSAVGTADEFKM